MPTSPIYASKINLVVVGRSLYSTMAGSHAATFNYTLYPAVEGFCHHNLFARNKILVNYKRLERLSQPYSFKRQNFENDRRYVQGYCNNRKSHMRFRWTPRSITLDDLELL